ncbi:MAG: aldo/keto reductase [Bacteroidales bacterium]|nr:aldo/keto reductase [Bacteroidales bacterium]
MKKIELGKTGELICCIGLGTMYFGSAIDMASSYTILDFYYESGGTFFDSANKYASWIQGCKGGESELAIGKWMNERGNRNHIFITSKLGFPYGNIPR